jgi:hypothetical protein
MAYEQNLEFLTRNSTNDLSNTGTYLYTGVKLDAAGQIVPVAATTDIPFGVLYSDPKAGKAAAIATGGAAKVKAGGTITAGQQIGFNAAGAAIAAVTGTPVCGVAMMSAAAGDIFTAEISFGSVFVHA